MLGCSHNGVSSPRAKRATLELAQLIRDLAVASEAHIREYFRRDQAEPPALEHAGVEDVFLGKGSTVWYWRTGKWVRLTTSG